MHMCAQCVCVLRMWMCSQLLNCVWLLVTPWTVAHQAPLFMEFPKQEYWSGLPFPTPSAECLDVIRLTEILLDNILATCWEELTYLKRPWWWERLKVGREGDDRGLNGWMASPTQWTWVWVNSRSWWWTGRPGVLQSMGLQRVRHDWADWTELNWTEIQFNLSKQLPDT